VNNYNDELKSATQILGQTNTVRSNLIVDAKTALCSAEYSE